MGLEDDILGDVISLGSSSDDERPLPKPKKRRRDDSDDTNNSSSSGKSAKRAKGSPPTKQTKEPVAPVSEEGEVSEDEDGALGAYMPTEPPTFTPAALKQTIKLNLPALSDRKEGSWFGRFRDWVRVFYTHNSHFGHKATTATHVLSAYTHYVDRHSGLKPGKKKGAKQAASKASNSGALGALLNSLRADAQVAATASKDAPGAMAKAVQSEPVPAEEAGAKAKPQALPPASEVAPPSGTTSNQQQTNGDDGVKPVSRLDMTDGPSDEKNGAATSDALRALPSDEELEMQRRYFPSASDASAMCLFCGREGHISTECTHSACRFCGKNGHWDFGCPTISTRCDKCRQLGHDSSTCAEKLKLTKDDGLACNFCTSPNHLEEDCTEIWRSFQPDAETIKCVVFLSSTCAICGSNSHFLSDCTQRRAYAGNPTWSLENRDRYIDQTCSAISIEEAIKGPAGAKSTRAPEVKIRGHAARTANIHYSESDDSDPEFLSQRPTRQRAPLGRIRMSSNIQMPGGNGPNNGYSQPPGLPPLPPGPPPPGLPPSRQPSQGYPPPPGVSSYSSQQPVPFQSLPARPPASSQNYRNMPPPPNMQGPSWQDGGPSSHQSRSSRSGRPKPAAQGQRGGNGGGGGGGGGRGGGGGGRGRGRPRGRGRGR